MDPECIAHRLTQKERKRFEEEGYLILPGVLPEEREAELSELADRDFETEALHPQALARA